MNTDNIDELLDVIILEAQELNINLELTEHKSGLVQVDRLVESFEEINRFIDEHHRVPEKCKNPTERKLAVSLGSIKSSPHQVEHLRAYDRHKLFPEKLESEDKLDLTDLLDDGADIFDVSKLPQKKQPDYIAKRKKCEDFEKYKGIFEECHEDLNNGKRKYLAVSENKRNWLDEGSFVMLKGMLAFVAHQSEFRKEPHGEDNCRLRLIFENGTESDLLMRSLFRSLYDDGVLVTNVEREELNIEGKKYTGCIYVLRSLSKNPEVLAIRDLYKIGVSENTMIDRISGAKNSATYLFADVEPVMEFKCYDVDVRKLETLIHKFFDVVRLRVEIKNEHGEICNPKEWFSVPKSIIQMAVPMIINGSIIEYRYDLEKRQIVPKEQKYK